MIATAIDSIILIDILFNDQEFAADSAAALAAFSFAAFSSGVSSRESNKAVDITVFAAAGGFDAGNNFNIIRNSRCITLLRCTRF